MAYTAEERALGLVLLAASWRDTEAAGSLTIWAMPAGGSSHVISQLLLLPIIIVLAPRAVKDMYKGSATTAQLQLSKFHLVPRLAVRKGHA